MLFNSLQFLIFFPVVTALYFLIPHRYRWMLLLSASCVFYVAFIPIYILVLFVTITIDYIAALLIERSEGKQKKFLLIISILSTCAVLFIFKYFNFFNQNFAAIAHFFNLNYPLGVLKIILPIGLSFHTFQSLSYVIEVYWGKQKAERNFGVYSLYVMFYPQLVAGPIERPQNLLHQFYEEHHFDYNRVTDGLKLMAWGIFKKVVIADRLSEVVNLVYGTPKEYQGLPLIIATVFFALQIFCDFSGYSDIAIGAAKVMGFNLMQNFNQPYYARSLAEFWRRWHISLSTWFRDYLYIPLGGNRVTQWRRYGNVFAVFLVSGLWHGASWTYVFWGAFHGGCAIVSISSVGLRDRIRRTIGLHKIPALQSTIQIIITFSLVCVGWVFFRAKDISDAFYIISHLTNGLLSQSRDMIWTIVSFVTGANGITLDSAVDFNGKPLTTLGNLFISITVISLLEIVHFIQRRTPVILFLSDWPVCIRWAVYYALILSIMTIGVFNKSKFIYFQF